MIKINSLIKEVKSLPGFDEAQLNKLSLPQWEDRNRYMLMEQKIYYIPITQCYLEMARSINYANVRHNDEVKDVLLVFDGKKQAVFRKEDLKTANERIANRYRIFKSEK